jgi:hypothetical protein
VWTVLRAEQGCATQGFPTPHFTDNGAAGAPPSTLVMVARLRAGDHAGALLAAEAAAPYCHPRLASADVRVRNEDAGMSDEELKAEIALLEARIKASETLN